MTLQMPLLEKTQAKASKTLAFDEAVDRRFPALSVVENFEALAEANGGPSALRQLVLDLAIRGRLVAPSKEAVEPLFDQIERKRATLVAARRASRLDEFSPLREEDVPFSIPASWRWVRLGQATICRDGQRIPVSKEERAGRRGAYDYYGASGVIDKIDDFIFDEQLLLIGEDGANLVNRSTPIAFIASGKYWVNNHAHVLDSASPEMLRFLAIFINAIDLVPFITGTAQPKMNQGKMNAIPVAIPPLAEQKRIVARVDQLMALIDDLEAKQTKKRDLSTRFTKSSLEALTAADSPEALDTASQRVVENFPTLLDSAAKVGELRKTVCELAIRGGLDTRESVDGNSVSLLAEVASVKAALIEAGNLRSSKVDESALVVEKPFAVPQTWAWVQVGDTYDVVGGIQKTPLRAPNKHHFPYLRVENVQRNRLNLERVERYELQDGELDRWRLAHGDLLVVEGNGSESEIGRCALWGGEIADCVHQNHLIRCRPIGPVWSPFLLLFLNSPSGAAEMRKLAITTSGLYSLSVGKIRGIWWPVPPLAEQKRIVAKVEQLMKLCDDLEAKLRRVEDRASKLVEAVVKEMVA